MSATVDQHEPGDEGPDARPTAEPDAWVAEHLDDGEVDALLAAEGGPDGHAGPDAAPRARLRRVLAQRRARGEPALYPLSWNQMSLWYLHELDPTAPTYHVGGAMRLRGPLDAVAFARAVQAVSDRHEALRTTFTTVGGRPFQLVHPRLETPVAQVDVAGLDDDALVERVQRDYAQPMDLRSGPGLKATLYLGGETPVFLVRIHHALMDLWSLAIVFSELDGLYAAECAGRPPELSPPPEQYPNFVRWQRELLASEAAERQARFWEEELRDLPPVLELPLDRPRPPLQSQRGRAVFFSLDQDVTKALRRLGRQEHVTSFVLLLAAYQALLFRYTGQERLGVGAPAAGRGEAGFRNMIGHCVNMMVLGASFDDDPSFRELLARCRRTVQDAMKHEDYPFSHLVARLGVQPDHSRTPLFQASMVFQQSPLVDMSYLALNVPTDRPVTIGELVLEPFPILTQQGQFDLSLWCARVGGAFHGELKYDDALFERHTIVRLAGHLQMLVRGVLADPDLPVSRVPLLSADDRTHIVEEWNETSTAYRRDACLHELFEEQAAATPDAVAVAGADRSLTYGELEQRSNQLAQHLRFLGVATGSLVAVLVDRSPEAVVALLGILKAGAGYVPLERHYPAARIRFILTTLGIEVAVTASAHLAHLDAVGADLRHLVCVDATTEPLEAEVGGMRVWGWDVVARQPATRPDGRATAEDTAYIIFTSGSTGTPKGVTVRHRPVINLIEWVNRRYGVGGDDRLLFITSLSFDLSVYDVFGSLAAGATIRIATRDEIQDPHSLSRILCEEGITIWDSAPPALNQLVPFLPAAAPSSPLRLVLLSGDWIPVKLPDQIRSVFLDAHVVSLGGATEATIWSNWYDIGDVDPSWPSIPYGRPIQNARYYILDPVGNPCPVGVPGDLYIGGECLADGYVKDPELTAAKFVPDPFVDAPGARMYDTGDRARFFPDGTIEFLGRRDFQVKVRGYRIELGEIETVLVEHARVRECAVLARDEGGGERYLVAYVTVHDGDAPAPSGLRAYLRDRLPEFMVPQHFVVLQALPLTPNGKLDRKALPAPERRREDLGTEYVPPATERERRLAEIWQQVLGVDRVGATDNFFDLGGESLRAVQIVYEIEARLGAVTPVSVLLRAPTVRELAGRLDGDGQAGDPTSLLVPLRTGTRGPTLFLLHPSGGEVVAYRALLDELDVARPLVGVQSLSRGGRPEPASVDEMADAYADAVVAAQPDGPYLVAGWSLGGVLAHAVATRLEQAGAEVAFCALVDSHLPGERAELRDRVLYRLGATLGPLAGSLADEPEDAMAALLARPEKERLRQALDLARRRGAAVADLPPNVLEREIAVARQHSAALEAHRPAVAAVGLQLVWAEDSLRDGQPMTDWGAYTSGGVEQTVLPGANHFTLWQSPHCAALCAQLTAALQTLPG